MKTIMKTIKRKENTMRPWKTCADLLDIFSVPVTKWRDHVEDLVEMGALIEHFQAGTLTSLERGWMREMKLSPLVYWSQIKRVLRPLLAAGGDTLRALGVPVLGEPRTAQDVLAALVDVLADEVKEEDIDIADAIGDRLAQYGY